MILLGDGRNIRVETLHSYLHMMLTTFGKVVIPKVIDSVDAQVLIEFVEAYAGKQYPFNVDYHIVENENDIVKLYFDRYPFSIDKDMRIDNVDRIYKNAIALAISLDTADTITKHFASDIDNEVIELTAEMKQLNILTLKVKWQPGRMCTILTINEIDS